MAKPKTGGPGSDQALLRDSRRREMAALKRRLEEAEESLNAIRAGEVDALVIKGPLGDQVYTLKDADRPYRTIIENMGEGAVTLRPDGLILYANRQFAAMLDSPLEDLLGSDLISRAAPSDMETLKRFLSKAQKGGARADVEFVKASGGPLLAHLSLAPMPVEGLSVLSGVIADMTEHRQTQEERTRLAAVVSQAVDGVIILDRAGKIIYSNPACQKISGFAGNETRRECRARTIRSGDRRRRHRHPEERGGLERQCPKSTERRERPIELDVSVTPLKNAAGDDLELSHLFPRHHPRREARADPPPDGAHRSPRPPGGRRRPRLEQYPAADHRQCRAPPRRRRSRIPRARPC